MFSGLFDENGTDPYASVCLSASHSGGLNSNHSSPEPPRHNCGFAGIYNQGATCYMNSLLQTLFMTPEFRECLFKLGSNELGRFEDFENKVVKVRIIPLQLQRLFSRLLLLNVQGVSTLELTDSFGWKSQEEVVQHDAQELNRILFSAVEDSLVGTSGQGLIKDLYHGVIVNQIMCEECGRVSEREEDFLDLCVTVTGNSSLQEGLENAYIHTESLDGHNKYRCERCSKLVNAKKGAKLRHLPPLLTLSLLRFNFDMVKLERFKETGKFSFPLEIDMARYCDSLIGKSCTVYELFSVVIHKGSSHGGHYHAYIRDLDNRGNWTDPDTQEVYLPADPLTGKVDFIEFDSPIELVQAIIAKESPEFGMAVDKLCLEMVAQTGVSWNKRFKKQYGPINKFLKKYDDKFLLNPATNWVSLRTYDGETLLEISRRHQSATGRPEDGKEQPRPGEDRDRTQQRPRPPTPKVGHRWYDFDDSRVRPIYIQEIEKQFSGKESAYMLFYRSKALSGTFEDRCSASSGLPENIYQQVMQENEKLEKERYEFDLKMNRITVEVHFTQLYTHTQGALRPLTDGGGHLDLEIDRRKSVAELRQAVFELGGELMCDHFVISRAKVLPAGMHLYQCLTDDLDKSLQSMGLSDKDSVFVWDGKQVGGEEILAGEEQEPVYLTVTYGNPDQVSRGFPKAMTLSEVKLVVMEMTGKDLSSWVLSRVVVKGEETRCVPIRPEEESRTLDELKLDNGDQLVCEDAQDTEHRLMKQTVVQHSGQVSFIVELRCKGVEPSGNFKVIPVAVSKDVTVSELKTVILSQENLDHLEEGGRLREDDPNLGLRTPLHEEQSLTEAGLKQGAKLVLEHGPAPTTNQITVNFTTPSPHGDVVELMFDRSSTVDNCLSTVLQKANLQGDGWHLRQTNCFQEATRLLEDEDLTLEQCNLRDGDSVLIEEGKLPPKGFIKLSVFYLPGHPQPESSESGLMSEFISGVKGLFSSSKTGSQQSDPASPGTNESQDSLKSIGDVVLPKDASLLDLKQQIMTLPVMSDLTVPTVEFMRVRTLSDNRRPTIVLRDHRATLQRLRLNSSSQLTVEILQEEENLNENQVVLSVRESRENRERGPTKELIWDVTKAGASSQALRQAVADLFVKAVDQIVIAKHLPEKYEWQVLQDSPQASQKKKKGKSKGQKVNIKQAPYHIKDGDEIAVKNLGQYTSKDDFCSHDDLQGKQRLKEEAEEKKKRRDELKQKNSASEFGGGDRQGRRRQEVGIRIHVDDFR